MGVWPAYQRKIDDVDRVWVAGVGFMYAVCGCEGCVVLWELVDSIEPQEGSSIVPSVSVH